MNIEHFIPPIFDNSSGMIHIEYITFGMYGPLLEEVAHP